MATAIHLVILAIFIIVCSRAITLLLYSVINNPWVCSSLLAASTVFFSLENCALLNEAQRKDEEIMALRRTHKQVREMEVELGCLRQERDRQMLALARLRLMYRRS